MAINLKGVKKKAPKKNRFGEPPKIADSGNNLEAPEHAPVEPTTPRKKARRKTGRTETFSTKVTADFLKEFKTVAFQNDLKIVELLEASFKAYKREKDK